MIKNCSKGVDLFRKICYAELNLKSEEVLLMNWMALFWLVLMLVFLAAESSTVVLVSLWFAAGALAAMIASLLGAQLWLQVTLFFAVAIGLLLLLRSAFSKFIKPKLVKTNVDAVVGTQGIVTERVDNISAAGQVKIGAMYWSARSEEGIVIETGTRVTVDRIEGVKVFVTPVKTPVEVQ